MRNFIDMRELEVHELDRCNITHNKRNNTILVSGVYYAYCDDWDCPHNFASVDEAILWVVINHPNLHRVLTIKTVS